MSMHDDIKTVLVSKELKAKVAELGATIGRIMPVKMVLRAILKGSVVFMADLMRAVSIPCNIDFMVVSSYGGSNTTTSSMIVNRFDGDLSGKDVLMVEDILNTSSPCSTLCPCSRCAIRTPLRSAPSLNKPSRRKADIQPDYEGFQVPDEFVVGYGLDFDEKESATCPMSVC